MNLFTRKPVAVPTAEEALPGRDEPIGRLLDDRCAARRGGRVAWPLSARAEPGRSRADLDRDRRSRLVLLRRELPPAVPGTKPERLLRDRRHRRRLPDRA